VLSAGIVISAAALPLSFFGRIDAAIVGLVCGGMGIGAMDAILRSGISKLVAMNKRGRAFGLYNVVFGAMWLVGSSGMGLL
jgi:MFS-type transporter involved in bile tolerance (Atg22 family)